MRKDKFTPENIQELALNEIFVFGSNRAGKNIGGAAYTAFEKFRAVWGKGEGLMERSYALPTLDEKFEKLSKEELKISFQNFFDTACTMDHLDFYLTKVGVGIAGYSVKQVTEAIRDCVDNDLDLIPDNVIMPKEFVDYLMK